mmetsp:Transcript_9499/g.14300  ORF Transcript_9499/g.14300 Transcript_9499/m.14300 type:complete len:248 (-) Transcript_9499:161-904(-)
MIRQARCVQYLCQRVLQLQSPPLSVRCCSSSPSGNSNSSSKSWSWVPPRQDIEVEEVPTPAVDVIEGQLLQPEEIETILSAHRAIDISVVQLAQKMDAISHFVICTGESRQHLKRIGQAIVENVRQRNLIQAPCFKLGIEGEKDDEWMCVDCLNCVVHIMRPGTRRALNLEDHWRASSRPHETFSMSKRLKKKAAQLHDENLDDLCDRYPPPDDYVVAGIEESDDGINRKENRYTDGGFIFTDGPTV